MYTNDHRVLLQVIMNEGAIVEAKLNELCFKLFSRREVQSICSQINEQLSTVNMMLKSALCDSSGETYWTVVSHSQLDFDTLHMPYNENQMNFLKTIFCEIVSSDVGCISSLDSLNLLVQQNFRMYKKDAQEFINDLVNKRWLSTREGWLFIGPRSTADLLNFFKDNFPNMLYECDLCRQNVFYGKLCNECNRKTHFKCLRIYTEKKNNDMACPSCNHAFDSIEDNLSEQIAQYHHSNGEESVDVIQSQVQNESHPSTSRGKRARLDSD